MTKLYITILFSLIFTFCAACSNMENPSAIPQQLPTTGTESASTEQLTSADLDNVDITTDPKTKEPLEISAPPADSNNASSSGSEAEISDHDSSSKELTENHPVSQAAPSDDPVIEPLSQYILFNFPAQMTKRQITDRFGKPLVEYVMADEDDPIKVMTYSGFSFGYDNQELLRFINIFQPNIDPQLKGVKVGMTAEDSQAILGEPQSNSGVVITYTDQHGMLKLDVDPDKQIIQSMTWFALNS